MWTPTESKGRSPPRIAFVLMSEKINLGRGRFAFVLVEATENVQGLGMVYPRVRFELRLHTKPGRWRR